MTKKTGCVMMAVGFAAGSLLQAVAGEVYKADNALPLNAPASWEGGAVPEAADVAVFDERVTTNTLNFLLTGNVAFGGLVVTNRSENVTALLGTVTIATNGADAAVMTLGAGGVSLEGSGLALTWNLPLVLSAAQTWQAGRRRLTFGGTVSGSSDWTMAGTSGVYWNVASGYSGTLAVPNASANSIYRFSQAGRFAKSLSLSGPNTSTRLELAFTGTVPWSTLFADRAAAVTNPLIPVTSGATLQFESGDSFAFPGGRFTVDNGNCLQNGGSVAGYELQLGYVDNNCLYTLNGGNILLSGQLLLGNGVSVPTAKQVFRQNGGTVDAIRVAAGYATSGYLGLLTYEMSGGTLYARKANTVDAGVHLAWNEVGTSYEASGAFLMKGGQVFADQVAFGRRAITNTAHAVTNAYSLFKMTGGEFYVGRNGIYADRTWNNGRVGAGYGVKLSGGTLGATDNWSSPADIFLSDREGGAVINTESTNGAPKTVVLSGALYGPGGLTKRGSGTLVLAGETDYRGQTTVEEGALMVRSLPAACARWTADSLPDASGASVLMWTDVNKGSMASNSVTYAPRLYRSELNGHNVVRFTGASSTCLAVAPVDNPISGATAFTIALVFKTGTAGVNISATDQWYRHTGLVDCEQPDKQYDWGMSYNPSGQVAAGAGDKASLTDTTVYSSAGYSVSDSQPHVALYMWRGTNITINLDGRPMTGATQAAAVVPRGDYRMLFGSVALGAGKYFNGDIAEIRIYRNQALTPDQQSQLGSELAATYGVANAVFAPPSSVAPMAGERPAAEPAVPAAELPYPVEVWDAATLAGAEGSAVETWGATGGVKTASLIAATVLGAGGTETAIAGRTAPRLALHAINGFPAVRFTGAEKNVLGISASDNPVAGNTNFTVALVFRTDAAGNVGADSNWYRYSGLLDAEEPGKQNDWGLSFNADGRVAAGVGLGLMSMDVTHFSKPFDLHDGTPHVLVACYNQTGSRMTVMVDGLSLTRPITPYTEPRNVRRLLLGGINGETGKFLTGDIAEFRLYPERVLADGELAGLSQELSAKYGVRPIPTGNTVTPRGSAGLASRSFTVAAGASLVLPAATNAPYALGAGQTISGGGAVRGHLALESGAVIETGLSSALTLDTLSLRDGAVVKWTHSGGEGHLLSVGTLKTAGTATLHVEGGDALPVRVSVIAFTEGEGLEATVWTVTGGKTNTRVEVNETKKTLDLVSSRGTLISIM